MSSIGWELCECRPRRGLVVLCVCPWRALGGFLLFLSSQEGMHERR